MSRSIWKSSQSLQVGKSVCGDISVTGRDTEQSQLEAKIGDIAMKNTPVSMDILLKIFLAISVICLGGGCTPATVSMGKEKGSHTAVFSKTPTKILSTVTPTRLPTLPATATSTPTLPPPLTPSSSPIVTVSPAPTLARADQLPNNLYVVVVDTGGATYFRNIRTGETKEIFYREDPIFGGDYYGFVGWSRSGCEAILVSPKTGKMMWVNLQGRVTRRISLVKQDLTNVFNVTFSPDEKWVSFAVAVSYVGEMEPRPRVMYLYVKGSAPESQPVLLGTNGGSQTQPEWSPDSQSIAFADYDDAHVQQLYIARQDGSARTQVTHLPASDEIDSIHWSPDGSKIAFSNGLLRVVDVQSPDYPVETWEKLYPKNLIWWDKDQLILANDDITLLDIQTGQSETLIENISFNSRLIRIKGTDLLFFWGNADFEVIDVRSRVTGYLIKYDDIYTMIDMMKNYSITVCQK